MRKNPLTCPVINWRQLVSFAITTQKQLKSPFKKPILRNQVFEANIFLCLLKFEKNAYVTFPKDLTSGAYWIIIHVGLKKFNPELPIGVFNSEFTIAFEHTIFVYFTS